MTPPQKIPPIPKTCQPSKIVASGLVGWLAYYIYLYDIGVGVGSQ